MKIDYNKRQSNYYYLLSAVVLIGTGTPKEEQEFLQYYKKGNMTLHTKWKTRHTCCIQETMHN